MSSRKNALLFLVLLVLLSACRRQESEGSGSPAENGSTLVQPDPGSAPEAVPDKPPAPVRPAPPQPSAEIRRETVLPTAFAAGDSGPSAVPLPLYDYELGELSRSIPSGFVRLVNSLGSELPEMEIAPEWQDHLLRQTTAFKPASRVLRMGLTREDEGILVAPIKIIADNQLILGSIRGRRQENGGYLIEDLALNRYIYPPYEVMLLPSPVLTDRRIVE